MGVSTRHTRRILAAYRKEGAAALAHHRSRHPFVNPAPQSSFRRSEGMPRTPIRGRNPEGVGRGKATRRWKKLTRRPIFILLCGLRKAMVIPAKAGIQGIVPSGAAPSWHTQAPMTPKRFQQPDPHATPPRKPTSYLGVPANSPHERLVRKWCYAASSMPECHRPPLRHSRGSGNPEGRGGTNDAQTLPATRPPSSYLGVPATAGMSDWYGSTSRTPIRDGWFPSRPLVSSCRRPLESPRTRHSYQNMPFNQPQCRLSTGETCRIVD